MLYIDFYYIFFRLNVKKHNLKKLWCRPI